jgi:Rieske Fe-S protein
LLKEKQIGINDLKVGESVFATYIKIKDGAPVSLVVARQDASTVVGFKPICTHLGGSLEFSEGSLLCLRHLARFNKLTRYVDAGPAIFPLRTEDIQIINSQPFVLL